MRAQSIIIGALTLLVVAGCDEFAPTTESPAPEPAAAPAPRAPSEQSAQLARYYSRVQAELLSRGLLRTDGGGTDTPYSTRMLAANFERITFFDEYDDTGSLRRSAGRESNLRRWKGPVRIGLTFGPSVHDEIRSATRTEVRDYAARLARITGHPITTSERSSNFHVLVMGEDDRDTMMDKVREIAPYAAPSTIRHFRFLPRDIHCFVVAFSRGGDQYTYTSAIALIRAEHPELLRSACIHEELAQGLGLANDSPEARPSIFNDDDEFALLTEHDEKLLAMLYDPRLSPGQSGEEARPVIRTLAREQMGRD